MRGNSIMAQTCPATHKIRYFDVTLSMYTLEIRLYLRRMFK